MMSEVILAPLFSNLYTAVRRTCGTITPHKSKREVCGSRNESFDSLANNDVFERQSVRNSFNHIITFEKNRSMHGLKNVNGNNSSGMFAFSENTESRTEMENNLSWKFDKRVTDDSFSMRRNDKISESNNFLSNKQRSLTRAVNDLEKINNFYLNIDTPRIYDLFERQRNGSITGMGNKLSKKSTSSIQTANDLEKINNLNLKIQTPTIDDLFPRQTNSSVTGRRNVVSNRSMSRIETVNDFDKRRTSNRFLRKRKEETCLDVRSDLCHKKRRTSMSTKIKRHIRKLMKRNNNVFDRKDKYVTICPVIENILPRHRQYDKQLFNRKLIITKDPSTRWTTMDKERLSMALSNATMQERKINIANKTTCVMNHANILSETATNPIDEECLLCFDTMHVNESMITLCGRHFMHMDCAGSSQRINTVSSFVTMHPALKQTCPVCRLYTDAARVHLAEPR